MGRDREWWAVMSPIAVHCPSLYERGERSSSFVRGVVGACRCLRWWALIAVCERGHSLPFVKEGAHAPL